MGMEWASSGHVGGDYLTVAEIDPKSIPKMVDVNELIKKSVDANIFPDVKSQQVLHHNAFLRSASTGLYTPDHTPEDYEVEGATLAEAREMWDAEYPDRPGVALYDFDDFDETYRRQFAITDVERGTEHIRQIAADDQDVITPGTATEAEIEYQGQGSLVKFTYDYRDIKMDIQTTWRGMIIELEYDEKIDLEDLHEELGQRESDYSLSWERKDEETRGGFASYLEDYLDIRSSEFDFGDTITPDDIDRIAPRIRDEQISAMTAQDMEHMVEFGERTGIVHPLFPKIMPGISTRELVDERPYTRMMASADEEWPYQT